MSGAIGLGFAPGLSAAAKALRILIAVGIVAALLALSYCQGRSDGKAHEVVAQQKAIIKVQKKAAAAGDAADLQRTADVAKQIEAEKQYADAIEAAPGGTNSPAATALACQRLRAAGYRGADLPAECGRQDAH